VTTPFLGAPWARCTADEVLELRGADTALDRALSAAEAAAVASHELAGLHDPDEATARVRQILRTLLAAFLAAARDDRNEHPLEGRELVFTPEIPWSGLFKPHPTDPEDDVAVVRDAVLPLAVLVWARCGHTERLLASPCAMIRTHTILALSAE
jgi:hypothetical protein